MQPAVENAPITACTDMSLSWRGTNGRARLHKGSTRTPSYLAFALDFSCSIMPAVLHGFHNQHTRVVVKALSVI